MEKNNQLEVLYPILIPKSFSEFVEQSSALQKQFVPDLIELNDSGFTDPIGDQLYQKTSMLIHRYKNRALFIPTTKCPIHCRYCFRKNELTNSETFNPDWENTLNYLSEHKEIEEIIFTGGDPFILSDEKIDFYLEAFSRLPQIKWIRFHTRTPVILPKRLSLELKNILSKYKKYFSKIIIVLHTNHVDEITPEFKKILKEFQDSEIPWLSQSVLLKEVNDSAETLTELFKVLSQLNISPYYLHHPDQVKGAMHFYISIEEGRRIYSELRDLLPGWLIPQYVLDTENGNGKVPIHNAENFSFHGKIIDRFGQQRFHNEPRS